MLSLYEISRTTDGTVESRCNVVVAEGVLNHPDDKPL